MPLEFPKQAKFVTPSNTSRNTWEYGVKINMATSLPARSSRENTVKNNMP